MEIPVHHLEAQIVPTYPDEAPRVAGPRWQGAIDAEELADKLMQVIREQGRGAICTNEALRLVIMRMQYEENVRMLNSPR